MASVIQMGANAFPLASVDTGAAASSSTYYTTFAKIPINSSGTAAYGTWIITSVGGALYPDKGFFIFQYLNRNSTLTACVQPFGTITGYGNIFYKNGGDGYWYIMAYRSASNGGRISVLPLSIANGYKPLFDNYGSVATNDGTWTKVPTRGFYRLDRVTTIASLADLKAQMTAWATDLGTGGKGYYNVTFSTSFTPFSGVHPMIEINMSDVANYGTAIITTYKNSAGCNMYLMSYYNGAWTDPATVTAT